MAESEPAGGGGVRLRVLGPVGITAGDRWLWLRSARVRTVLATLVLRADSVVPVDELIQAVWDADPPRTAQNQIQIAVSTLRGVLARLSPAGTPVVTQPPGYVLRVAAGAIGCDLVDFSRAAAAGDRCADRGEWAEAYRHYESAAALWRGPACQDVGSTYLRPWIAAIEQQRAGVRERQLGLDLLLGRHDRALGELARLIEDDPMRERLWYLLMLAQAADGRQSEALDTYRTAHARFVAELGLEPGEELRALQRTVLDGDLEPARRVVEGWVAPHRHATARPPAPAWLTPRQLPADISDFVGRTTQSDLLDRLIAAGGAVALTGPGGVGKTALAVRAARRAEWSFPDGCLFVDLHGTGRAASAAHTVTGSLLVSLGIPAAAVPAQAEARLGLYRSVIAERRLLIVLDNAADAAQVAALLPGSTRSAVLVTSRRMLTALDGVPHVTLEPFTEAEALELLARLAGADRVERDRTAARRIVALCDRLPLALRLVGIRLADRDDMPLTQMAGRLADEQDRLDEIATGGRELRASIALGVDQLDADDALLLGRIALLPVPDVPVWLAASLAGTGPVAAERAMERLRQASLLSVTRVRDETRFRPHDLIRLYAREQVLRNDPAPAREAALVRAYGTLLRLARHADSRLDTIAYPMPEPGERSWWAPGPVEDAVGDPAAWFEDNSDLIIASVRDALRHGWHDLAWRLAVAPTHAFTGQVFDGVWQDVMEQTIAALRARPAPRDTAAAAVLLAYGGLLRERGERERAYRYLSRARLDFSRGGDPYRAAVAATQLGMAARGLGRRRVARAAVDWALATFDGCADVRHDGWAHLAHGNLLYEERADLAAADRAYRRALAAMRRAGDPVGAANVQGCLGMLRERQGQLAAAARLLAAAREASVARDNLIGRAPVETALARLELRRGRLRVAWRWHEQALETVRRIRNPLAEARLLQLRADLLLRLDRPDEAVIVAGEALTLAAAVGSLLDRAETEFVLARAQHAIGDPNARNTAAAAAATFASIDHPGGQAVADWLSRLGPRAAPAGTDRVSRLTVVAATR